MLRAVRVLKAVPLLAARLCLLGASTAVSAADLVDTMRADGRFNQLVRAIEAAELADTLRGPEPLTVFAPTDEAFAGGPAGELRDLLAGDRERLRTLLRHHVVEGRRPSHDLPPELPSLAGEPLAAEFEGTLTVADGDQRVTVVAGDIEADNGLIHAIDGVLVPSTLTQPAPEVAAEQPRDEEEDAGAAAAGPEVAIGQPGQEAGVEIAAGQEDGTRQVEAGVPTGEPREQPREQPEVTAAPAEADETAEATVAVVPSPSAETAEPEQVERPQPEVREQPPQQQTTAAQPEQAEPQQQQQVTAAQPGQPESQQQGQQDEQRPVQQARLTEEPPATGEEAAPPAAALTSLETLSDRTVRSSDGEVEGRVADLIFSRETGEIELVVVEYGGFLGLGRKSVAVPWQEVRFDSEADQLIIAMSRAELQEAPAFDYEALDTERYAQYRR